MNTKPISPRLHGLIDYATAGSLLALPPLLGFSRSVRKLYTIEAVALLAQTALTDHPVSLKPLIPFSLHGKVDAFSLAQFALQTGLRVFRNDRRAQLFNIGLTALTGFTVLLTDWHGSPRTTA